MPPSNRILGVREELIGEMRDIPANRFDFRPTPKSALMRRIRSG